ncbi:energy transducer TonB [Aliikangiella sp. IMCC44359]|uniref:energy transducer TonB n=1 Tax=Aliikangiella sp. IMCC44359 TaxID=3459125 RepID=UPI00403AB351
MNKLVAFGLACVFSFFLFVLMNFLIDNEVQAVTPEPNGTITFATIPKDKKATTIARKPLKKLPKLEKPVKQPPLITTEPTPTKPKPPRVAIRPELGDSKVGLSDGVGGPSLIGEYDGVTDGNLAPLVRIEPQYPRVAALNEIEGYVTLTYDVDEEGRAINIKIVDAKPKGYFEKVSRKALRKWKFKPQEEDGEKVAVLGQQVTLTFQMEGEQ